MCAEGSVTHWITELKAGQEGQVQQELWNRYFGRLVALARKTLGDAPRRVADEEDVALAALNSFFGRIKEGYFPQLRDRSNLWPLLVKITVHKALDQRKRQLALKRSGQRARYDLVVDGWTTASRQPLMEGVVGTEPEPQLFVELTERCEQLLARLDKEPLRRIAIWKLEGYTNADVAAKLGVSERTIDRKLGVIRKCWSDELPK